ncbi:YopX family protein [Paenibacillus sp. CMAA1739]|uniref:YopX family protein n=1 Tax=Paenibacillus ottowii TaxID=2315729 RepID=UPI002DB5F73C|nr:YopX family protein [Paenibacillus sp. CMAA1739]MEC4566748.1 YopX family protein [Paenibacillus sp. CMAA1739]
MRDIKFRGISVERLVGDNQWLEGFGVDFCEMTDGTTEAYLYTNFNGVCRVIPKTVGQYTGLKDSKRTPEFPDGQEIYEDDICTAEEMQFPLSGTRTGIVKYIDGSYLLEDLDGKDGDYLFSESAEITVIGNIHDNPELLQPQGGGKGE